MDKCGFQLVDFRGGSEVYFWCTMCGKIEIIGDSERNVQIKPVIVINSLLKKL